MEILHIRSLAARSNSMIKIDWKAFIHDRIWFGWWYCTAKDAVKYIEWAEGWMCSSWWQSRLWPVRTRAGCLPMWWLRLWLR